jgi:hypothetical protein
MVKDRRVALAEQHAQCSALRAAAASRLSPAAADAMATDEPAAAAALPTDAAGLSATMAELDSTMAECAHHTSSPRSTTFPLGFSFPLQALTDAEGGGGVSRLSVAMQAEEEKREHW